MMPRLIQEGFAFDCDPPRITSLHSIPTGIGDGTQYTGASGTILHRLGISCSLHYIEYKPGIWKLCEFLSGF